MDVRSELIRLENLQRTDLVATEGALLGAEVFSVGAEVGAVASLEEVETEVMAEADLIPEVEDTMAPETTIIAGKVITTTSGLLRNSFEPIACLT